MTSPNTCPLTDSVGSFRQGHRSGKQWRAYSIWGNRKESMLETVEMVPSLSLLSVTSDLDTVISDVKPWWESGPPLEPPQCTYSWFILYLFCWYKYAELLLGHIPVTRSLSVRCKTWGLIHSRIYLRSA